jgi:hypothetical protein
MPMGDFSTSETKTQQQNKENVNTNMGPWGGQSDYLKDIFGDARSLFEKQQGSSYNGDFLAKFNPQQLDMFGRMVNYAKTSPIASMLAYQGSNLADIGQGGVRTGMEGLTDFRPTASTMGTIADAGLYADNPFISGMVDAATRDASRATYEGQLPANARAAALSGNANSSKRFIGDAIAERGLQDRRADVSAQLRGDAYNQGADRSLQMNQFNDDATLRARQALMSGGLDAANSGADSLAQSLASQGALFGLGNEGAAGLQASEQNKIDNALSKYTFNKDDPWGSLMNYFNIIGGKNWGQSGTVDTKGKTTGTAQQTASPAATIGGILTSIGSLIPGK